MCPNDFHCSGCVELNIIAVHSYVQNGSTVLIQISVSPLYIPEHVPSMLASLDDVQESPEHIPAQPPEDERLTLQLDPKYHIPGIRNGVQAQGMLEFSFPLTSDFRFS